jgi:RNA polymerase sigma factor (sigma-70 family)
MYTISSDCNVVRQPAPAGTLPDETLICAARDGDRAAQQSLYTRCLPLMQRWARNWLPRPHRGLNDADDLVQIAMLRTWHRLGQFEVRSASGFMAYLHRALRNEVHAELRRCGRQGISVACDDTLTDHADLPIDRMLDLERECVYASALRRLSGRQRRHIELRVEQGLSFGEIAALTGSSKDGARMMVARALRNLSRCVSTAAA